MQETPQLPLIKPLTCMQETPQIQFIKPLTYNVKREAELFLYETIQEKLLAITKPTDQWLCMTSYANGCRVQETCDLEYSNIEWNEEFLLIHSVVLKKRKNEKTGIAPKPRRYCPVSRKLENWLTEPIIEYVSKNRQSLLDNTKIWPYSKRTAQKRFDTYFGCTSHSMRHNRATHLMKKFGYTTRDLAEHFILSPRSLSDWTMRYGHLEQSYLQEKLTNIVNKGEIKNEE